jgi:hypothetical protein
MNLRFYQFESRVFTLITVLLFSGCSSTGMMTAGHNGKKYWNPGNCSKYEYYYSNPDKIHCITNGVKNGAVLEPVSQQQLDNHYREQELSSSSSNSSSNNTVSCYRMGDIGYNKKIETFNGGICPLGYLKNY